MTQRVYLTLAAILLLAVSAYLSYQYLTRRTEEKLCFMTFFKPVLDKNKLVFGAVGLAISLGIYFYNFSFKNDVFLHSFINAEVFLWLLLIGYIDLKEKIIPNATILVGLIFWVLVVLANIFIGKVLPKDILVFSLVGVSISAILFVIALAVKSALGMGDVKMFLVLGLLYGLADTYTILLFSVIIMGITSVVLLLTKKATKKTAIPMAPFTAIGFLLSILAGL